MTTTARPAGRENGSDSRGAWTERLSSGATRKTSAGGGAGRRSTRSWGLISLAALLVVASGLGVAAWGLRAGDRVSVIGIGRDIPMGQEIQRADLVSLSVAGLPGTIPIADLDRVVGRVAGTDLVRDQVLTPALLADGSVPATGESTVGLALAPNRVPSGLEPGDRVDVVSVPSADAGGDAAALDAPEILTAAAVVLSVDDVGSVDGQRFVTVIVGADAAARVATYSAQGLVAVFEVEAQALPSESAGSGGPR